MGSVKAFMFLSWESCWAQFRVWILPISGQLMIAQQVVFSRKQLELTWVVYGVKIRPSHSYLQLERGCV